MSITARSYVVVGIKVTRDAFYTKTEIRNCNHTIPEKAKFCQECGKPATKTKEEPIDGYDECDRYLGLELVHPGYESDEVILGRIMATLGSYGEKQYSIELDQGRLEEARQEVMDILEGSPFKESPETWFCYCVS